MFNQKIESDTLPKMLTSLTFGENFNQKIKPNSLPENLTTLIFGLSFNQKIKPNSLPVRLSNLTFGWNFNQKIDSEMLSSNIKNINFNWLRLNNFITIEQHDIDMINNIPNYYYVNIFLQKNIFNIDGPKWPIHVIDYRENKWSPEIYKIQDKYEHPNHGPITILINKETYQSYSSAKSALK